MEYEEFTVKSLTEKYFLLKSPEYQNIFDKYKDSLLKYILEKKALLFPNYSWISFDSHVASIQDFKEIENYEMYMMPLLYSHVHLDCLERRNYDDLNIFQAIVETGFLDSLNDLLDNYSFVLDSLNEHKRKEAVDLITKNIEENNYSNKELLDIDNTTQLNFYNFFFTGRRSTANRFKFSKTLENNDEILRKVVFKEYQNIEDNPSKKKYYRSGNGYEVDTINSYLMNYDYIGKYYACYKDEELDLEFAENIDVLRDKRNFLHSVDTAFEGFKEALIKYPELCEKIPMFDRNNYQINSQKNIHKFEIKYMNKVFSAKEIVEISLLVFVNDALIDKNIKAPNYKKNLEVLKEILLDRVFLDLEKKDLFFEKDVQILLFSKIFNQLLRGKNSYHKNLKSASMMSLAKGNSAMSRRHILSIAMDDLPSNVSLEYVFTNIIKKATENNISANDFFGIDEKLLMDGYMGNAINIVGLSETIKILKDCSYPSIYMKELLEMEILSEQSPVNNSSVKIFKI